MNQTQPSSRRRAVLVGLGVLVVGTVLWAFATRGDAEPAGLLPPELSVESLQAQTMDRGKVREMLEREDLSEEQRQELRKNMREVWRSAMDRRLAEYFAAADADRQAVLDRHIDELQERRKQWEQRRKEREQNGDNAESRREDFRNRVASMSQQERKERSESRNPDQTAQRMAYFSAMRNRMSERGIEMTAGGWRAGRGGGGHGGRSR
ncbi:MAG: hypothetical protein ACE5GE_02950 [Phycisphaerae bacterium]